MAFSFTHSTPATAAVAIFSLKELMKTQGWTVLSSSDGTTYNSSGDQITTGGTGAGGMENTRAWFRIESPDNQREFTVQRTTINTQWRVKYSWSAGFVGGSPAATVTPSAADETILQGGGTDASPSFASLFTTDGTYRFNAGSDDADGYGFWATAFVTGGGLISFTWIFDPLEDTHPSDAEPYAHMLAAANSDISLASIISESSTNGIRSFVASATPTTFTVINGVQFNSGTGQVMPEALGANPISGFDEVCPIILMRRGAASNPGYKGKCSLMKFLGTARTTGDTLTVSTLRDRVVMDTISLPWDGTVPTV